MIYDSKIYINSLSHVHVRKCMKSFVLIFRQILLNTFVIFKANYSRLPPNKVQLDVLQGRIIGTESLLPNDKPFYAFKGIPYAQPPIGQLRFAVRLISLSNQCILNSIFRMSSIATKAIDQV